MIKKPPLREPLADRQMRLATVWALWLEKLVLGVNKPVTTNDIEIQGSAVGLILESPNGTRWRVQVDNAGNLTTTSL